MRCESSQTGRFLVRLRNVSRCTAFAVRACSDIRSRQPGSDDRLYSCKFHAIQHLGRPAVVTVGFAECNGARLSSATPGDSQSAVGTLNSDQRASARGAHPAGPAIPAQCDGDAHGAHLESDGRRAALQKPDRYPSLGLD